MQIRLVSIGQRWRLPPSLCSLVERVEGETQGYSGMTLCLALSYGGRDEVLRATQSLAQKAKGTDTRRPSGNGGGRLLTFWVEDLRMGDVHVRRQCTAASCLARQ